METADRHGSTRTRASLRWRCRAIALGVLLAMASSALAQVGVAANGDRVEAAAPIMIEAATEATPPPSGDAAGRRGGASPGAALLLGIAATALPLGFAVYSDGNAGTWVGGLTGVLIGPGVGLAAGGRTDLALRGVLIRTGGLALVAVGAAVFGAPFETDIGSEFGALIILGGIGGAVTAASMFWDLGITYGATDKARESHASLGVRPDGVVTVTWRY